jgi:acetylornithine/N-succinyldiaminopimelate aminotransferase
VLRRVRDLGARLREALQDLDGVREVRGRGLMIGVGLETGIDAHELSAGALKDGLVLNVPEPGTLRLLPPLVICASDLERAVTILDQQIQRSGPRRAPPT